MTGAAQPPTLGSWPSVATACVVAVAALFGCEEPSVPFLETKGIDERLTQRDLKAFLAVATAVGEAEASRLPRGFPSPPVWSDDRTLPVGELIVEERESFERAWLPEEAATKLPAGPPWDAAIADQRLTREQFCALSHCFAAALGRAAADPALDFEDLARRGDHELEALADDERPWSALHAVERHAILRRAAWLAIADRATHLAEVPLENVRFVNKHRERLAAALPAGFLSDPFAGLYPRAEDYGIPFEEANLSDADLTWTPEHALIGIDRPDDADTAR